MKVIFSVPKASVLLASIQIENKYWYVREIAALCRTAPSYSTDDTSAIISLQIDCSVQAAGYGADITAQTAATTFQPIDRDGIVTISKFTRETVAKIMKGVVYLIPGTNYLPVAIVPNYWSTNVGGTGTIANAVVTATNFRYNAFQDDSILNAAAGQITNCITCVIDGAAMEGYDAAKAIAKTDKQAMFAQSIGAIETSKAMISSIRGVR